MTLLSQLLKQSRLLNVLYSTIPDHLKESSLYSRVLDYAERYLRFNKIDVPQAITIYNDYLASYTQDCKHYQKTSLYPVEVGVPDHSLRREEYDVVLIFSVLFSEHRIRMMQLIEEQSPRDDKSLLIGIGAGLEMVMLREKNKKMYAYDLGVNDFIRHEFPDAKIAIELYTNQYPDTFNSAYLIEVLEHVKDPFALLEVTRRSLIKGGKLFITTAINIPQFDHLYKFSENSLGFENKVKDLGFKILFQESIPHRAFTVDVNSSNGFYTLQKI